MGRCSRSVARTEEALREARPKSSPRPAPRLRSVRRSPARAPSIRRRRCSTDACSSRAGSAKRGRHSHPPSFSVAAAARAAQAINRRSPTPDRISRWPSAQPCSCRAGGRAIRKAEPCASSGASRPGPLRVPPSSRMPMYRIRRSSRTSPASISCDWSSMTAAFRRSTARPTRCRSPRPRAIARQSPTAIRIRSRRTRRSSSTRQAACSRTIPMPTAIR